MMIPKYQPGNTKILELTLSDDQWRALAESIPDRLSLSDWVELLVKREADDLIYKKETA